MNDMLTAQTVELLQQMIRNKCVNDGTLLSGQEVRNSDTLRAYLVTVSHLGRLPRNPETHVLVGNFQGGVELLRILDQAGRVDDGVIEERLRARPEIHTTAAVPEDAAAAELEWIVTLVAELPEAPEAYPGRAPVESALLAAMVPREGAPVFEWRGLDYRIERSRTLAGTMTSNLEVQQIPLADTFVAVSHRLEGHRLVQVDERRVLLHVDLDVFVELLAFLEIDSRGDLVQQVQDLLVFPGRVAGVPGAQRAQHAAVDMWGWELQRCGDLLDLLTRLRCLSTFLWRPDLQWDGDVQHMS